MTTKTISVTEAFARACRDHPSATALETSSASWTYAELSRAAARITRALQPLPEDAVVGIRSESGPATLVAALAVLGAGRAYVRLDPRDPVERTRAMIRAAGCACFVVDEPSRQRLEPEFRGRGEGAIIDADAALEGRGSSPEMQPQSVSDDDLACVQFTSGERGPLGVAITHGNLRTFVEAMERRFALEPGDRVMCSASAACDLGLLEALLAWKAGARVCLPSPAEALLPIEFARAHEISFWCLSPSQAAFLAAVKALEPGLLPSLRQTVFVSEDLTDGLARRWSAAAPRSVIDVLYGPTEATAACLAHRWHPQESRSEDERLPLGRPLPGVDVRIVDDAGRDRPAGGVGHLLVAGPQVARGYWRRPDETARSFQRGSSDRPAFFRTGDFAVSTESGLVLHRGRADRQVRVRGFRVELGEVEGAIGEFAGQETVTAVGWPLTERGADGLIAFVESERVDVTGVRRALRARLPRYMRPSRIVGLPRFPRTGTGEIDRGGLIERLGPV